MHSYFYSMCTLKQPAPLLHTNFNSCATCQQVGTATSTTTPWGVSCAMQSCMKSAPAQVKSAGSLSDEPSTPCTNNQKWEMAIAKDCNELSAVDEHSYSHPGPYTVGAAAAGGMLLDYHMFENH